MFFYRKMSWKSNHLRILPSVTTLIRYGQLLLLILRGRSSLKTGSTPMWWLRQVATSAMPDWYYKGTVQRSSDIRSRGYLTMPLLHRQFNPNRWKTQLRRYGHLLHSGVIWDRDRTNRYGYLFNLHIRHVPQWPFLCQSCLLSASLDQQQHLASLMLGHLHDGHQEQ